MTHEIKMREILIVILIFSLLFINIFSIFWINEYFNNAKIIYYKNIYLLKKLTKHFSCKVKF